MFALMHFHGSALHLLTVFLGVVLVGTFWRLAAMHLAASSNGTAKTLGKAMAIQY
jgi:hypothetical protein